ncbi:MAG: hypothetical protein EPN91_07690 [Salinibacterium sp.]|nr:MAG: hypothetical protein EPN91_07690 [Salinibacterium sp.]
MIRTKKIALAEAVRRWGKSAAIKQSMCLRGDPAKAEAGDRNHKFYLKHCSGWMGHSKDCSGERPLFTVGVLKLGGMMFRVHGEGATWGEAFDRAAWNDHGGGLLASCVPCRAKNYCEKGKALRAAIGLVDAPIAKPYIIVHRGGACSFLAATKRPFQWVEERSGAHPFGSEQEAHEFLARYVPSTAGIYRVEPADGHVE